MHYWVITNEGKVVSCQIDCKSIKLWSWGIYINDKPHCKIIDGKLKFHSATSYAPPSQSLHNGHSNKELSPQPDHSSWRWIGTATYGCSTPYWFPWYRTLNLTNVSSLSLSIVNFRSTKNKQAELQAYLVVEHLNIVLSTESHLHGSVLNSEIFPSHIVIVHANTFDSFKKLVYQYYNMWL